MSRVKQHEEDKKAKQKAEDSENQELTLLLNKFRKDDILTSIIETPSYETPVSKKNKQNLIQDAISFLTEKFSDLDELILFLHLKYLQTQKRERKWNVFEIKDAKKLKKSDLSSDKVSNSMLKYFNRYNVSCKIFSEKSCDCIWTVMFFDDKPKKTPTCFLVHMKLSLVWYHNLNPIYSLVAEKVLRKTYRGTDVKVLTTINANPEYIQSLNIKTWRSLLKGCLSSAENKKINVVDDLQNSFVTHGDKDQTAPLSVLQNTFVVQGTGRTGIQDDFQSDFISENVGDKALILDDLRNSLVNHDIRNKSKTPSDLHSCFVTENVRDKTIILDKLQSSPKTNIRGKTKTPSDLHSSFGTENVRDEAIVLDKSHISLVTHDVREKTKTSGDLHSSFVAQDIRDKIKILDDVERSFVTEDIRNKNKISDDFEHSAYVSEKLPSIVNENKRKLRRKRKYVRETFENLEIPILKNLKYTVKSNSFGTWENTNSVCVVKFQGKNILKGLGMLVNSGMADSPLPDYLCKEPKTGKIQYVVTA